ncbi:hypothetical protein MAMP_01080 [Methylophaga aminisulfidivorans MP]|uniref:Uncharacterized protein n=1 Tax=Methylophaga aminisulfidivorans MP TaxID=1026882 RepID=F5T2F2_9GAMM|nr:hypothetical protein MAMP_01080 [Methylophaga aminisulfidivorans MP]
MAGTDSHAPKARLARCTDMIKSHERYIGKVSINPIDMVSQANLFQHLLCH